MTIDDDDIRDDEGVNPFSPAGVLPDPGPVTSIQSDPGPYDNPAPRLSPTDFVRRLLQMAASNRRNLAQRPHISAYDGVQYSQPMLLQAEAIDAWLLNGHQSLTIEQMGFVLDAMEEPESPTQLAGTLEERTSWDRERRYQADILRQQKWYAERDVTRGRR